MEEKIELNEVIKDILKGKWLVVLCMVSGLLISGILSWFVLEERYESKAVLQIAQNIDDAGVLASYAATEFTTSVYMQRMKNESSVLAFEEAGYDPFNKSNLTFLNDPNTPLIELSYKSSTAENAQKHLILLMETTKAEMESSLKSTLKRLEETYSNDLNILSNEIEQLTKQYNNLVVSNKLPDILILQTVVSNQYMVDLTQQQLDAIANITGALQSELLQLRAKIDIKTSENFDILKKYQSVKTGLTNFNAEPFIHVISEPTLEKNSISPDKSLNLVIGLILGAIIGLAIVFIRMYMGNTKVANK